VQNDSETADENVPNAFGVQGFAEREKVFEFRCA